MLRPSITAIPHTDRIVFEHRQRSVDSGPHEGFVVSGHGHGEEAHGYGAGFGYCEGVLAMG